ncbi:phage tail assembly protein [Serratia fonticola]|uniref:phage tail assembly protein n=1 Tax=Serratia fonticola TaxID=47917 RepID=UPI00192D09A5|nr:phage tail assembly protein [Serratia fonticola]MBL5827650.1 phage tail assembly protein [Serratia fonticola]
MNNTEITLEKSKIIVLSKPIEVSGGKLRYEQIELKEPVLIQVEQFYERQSTKNGMSAMKLLIALTSDGVPEAAISHMDFTDYKECEAYLMGFLTFDPSNTGKEQPPM